MQVIQAKLLNLFLVSIFLFFSFSFSQKEIQAKNSWWKSEAHEMVESQIIERGVRDKNVIKVMKDTPRHLFVPNAIEKFAYQDGPLPIGHGQTISQPYIVALMTELLKLKGNEKVLEIGTGSGYQAAILSKLAKKVFTIEVVEPLANTAQATLKNLGYKNVFVKYGDGYKGWPKEAPFDAIIITAAPENIPEELTNQLKIGGRMVVPVGKYNQELILITKEKDGIKEEKIIPVIFVPMIMGK